ncbi:MAG: acyl-ACP--UDP-N-acetylglucosamine O-acyltransferase [Pseudomonadota bacterium]
MAVSIDPHAVVAPGAQLGTGVKIGPFCNIGADVVLGDGVEVISHAVIDGKTTVGAGTKIFPFTSLGVPPQDLKYKGEPTTLVIGKNCQIREHVTAHRGTAHGKGETRVGDDSLIMIGVHIAHDCQVGARAIFANGATLGGHVTIGEQVFIGGLTAIHQFVRVGSYAYVGGMAAIRFDVIPCSIVMGADDGRLSGLNLVGLKRRGLQRDEINVLRRVYKTMFRESGTMKERFDRALELYADEPAAQEILSFIREGSARSYLRDNMSERDDDDDHE